MFRRQLLNVSALALPAAALAACTTTTSGGVTTLTIDTAKVDADGSAIITALASLLATPSLAILLGANAVIADAALAAAKLALAQFDTATNGSLSVSVDTTKAISLVNSLLSDAQTILAVVQPVVPKLPGATAAMATNYINAILTLIPFVQAAVDLSLAAQPAKGVKLMMTEAAALKIATH